MCRSSNVRTKWLEMFGKFLEEHKQYVKDKKSVNKGTFYYGIIILDNNHSWEVSFLINNKLKNCCNDCVHCEIVTETKRRAIPDNKTEVVLVNIKCSHMCVCYRYREEVQNGR